MKIKKAFFISLVALMGLGMFSSLEAKTCFSFNFDLFSFLLPPQPPVQVVEVPVYPVPAPVPAVPCYPCPHGYYYPAPHYHPVAPGYYIP